MNSNTQRFDRRQILKAAGGFGLMAFGASVYLVRFVPEQFFPSSDRPELVVDLTLRQNASIFASETVATRLEEALAKIPRNFREAVVLRDLEGLSYGEIAEVLGVRIGTVRSRIARGRDRLRQELEVQS